MVNTSAQSALATPLDPPLRLRLNILSDPANVAVVRHAVEELARGHGFDTAACDEVALCVNEALANVIRHAYRGAADKPIDISVEVEDDPAASGPVSGSAGGGGRMLRIRIRDWGSGVDPSSIPARAKDPMTPGGLGLICLHKMMDQVRFLPQPDGMLLEMSRRKKR